MKYRVKTGWIKHCDQGDIVEAKENEPYEKNNSIPKRIIDNNPDWFEEVEEEFEVGDWVILTDRRPPEWAYNGEMDGFLGSIQKIRYISNPNIGFYGNATTNWAFSVSDIKRKATDDEIEQALIKEYKRRGGKVGGYIRQYRGLSADKISGEPYLDGNRLVVETENLGSLWVYSPNKAAGSYGDWVKFVDQKPPIKIHDHDVDLKEKEVVVGCQSYAPKFIMDLNEVTKVPNIELMVDGKDVSEQISQIAEYYE